MMPDFSVELPFFAYIRQEQAGDSETPCDGGALATSSAADVPRIREYICDALHFV
jgi:hypothetical protein